MSLSRIRRVPKVTTIPNDLANSADAASSSAYTENSRICEAVARTDSYSLFRLWGRFLVGSRIEMRGRIMIPAPKFHQGPETGPTPGAAPGPAVVGHPRSPEHSATRNRTGNPARFRSCASKRGPWRPSSGNDGSPATPDNDPAYRDR